MTQPKHIIGIDCATKSENTGLASAKYANGKFELNKLCTGSKKKGVVDIVSEWIKGSESVLLALDAPLGWPTAMGSKLVKHMAGKFIPTEADEMFSRNTDERVQKETKKKPLEVGADRIARMALATLKNMDKLQKNNPDREIELRWNHKGAYKGISIIEVYPKATLIMCGLPFEKYKNASKSEEDTETKKEARGKILNGLLEYISMGEDQKKEVLSDDDKLDAVVCILAGLDFLDGKCFEPEDKEEMETAKKEGWIWFRKRDPSCVLLTK
jgi:predicted RNase H-like nuclease